jgi:hypothetical protein
MLAELNAVAVVWKGTGGEGPELRRPQWGWGYRRSVVGKMNKERRAGARGRASDMHWGFYWFSLKFLPKAEAATPINNSMNILSGAQVGLNAQ